MKINKIISIIITLSLVLTMSSFAFAAPPGFNVSASMTIEALESPIENVLSALQWIGYAFAIGMLVYVGIKYTMSLTNEKADLKKGLINYVIGAIVIAAASTIFGWIITFTG